VIVTRVLTPTPDVVIVNVAEFCPAGTIVYAGTTAKGLLLAKMTLVPPGPAGPVRATLPVTLTPPATVAGLMPTNPRFAAVTSSSADWDAPSHPAVIVTTSPELTPLVRSENDAVDLPAATAIVAGAVALALFENKGTTNPPDGAACESVTLPATEAPP
jgi:hypothetical protein